ncbi:MAG TPA: hypothetical protein VK452_06145 [Dissulfurispiraceae bacterium]|nr:hypothetical protein [Dissulfurispiraceae bacterium]
MLLLCTILLVGLFMLPFLPAIREVMRKDDASPLFINMEYSKDPRYFAISFRRLLLKSAGDLPEGIHNITISKSETIKITNQADVPSDSLIENVFYVKNSLKTGSKVSLQKETYCQGNAQIGESNSIKAVACDGNVDVGKDSTFLRWIDSEKDMTIAENCNLGISATCSGKLSIAVGCTFMRLYGAPIIIAENNMISPAGGESVKYRTVVDGAPTERGISSLPPHDIRNSNLIAEGSLSIGEHAVIHGHIKSHGKIVLGASAVVMGNLFAEKDIEVGPGSRVYGSIFSQGCVKLQQGVTVGDAGRIKSVIGKKGISLECGVRVYGYVATEGKGIVG